jgi:very-short-patch-repair endonuclease
MNEIETMFYDELKRLMEKETEIVSECGKAVVSYSYDESTKDWMRGQARIKTAYGFIDFIIGIRPQFKIGRYKVDFIIYFDNPYVEENYVAIEIDGHEWHEKTKEQVMYDKQRERYLLQNDYPAMRFSGTEVFHNCEQNAKECFSIMIDRSIIKLQQCRKAPEILYTKIKEEDYDYE